MRKIHTCRIFRIWPEVRSLKFWVPEYLAAEYYGIWYTRQNLIVLNNKNGTVQSRKDESVISRRRRKTDYHCLGPWTAEPSGKWPGGRKSPCQATAIKNTEEQQLVSEMASAKPLPILGGVAGSRCSAVAHRRDAVIRCQWLVHRHLTTAYRRQQWRPPSLLPPWNEYPRKGMTSIVVKCFIPLMV